MNNKQGCSIEIRSIIILNKISNAIVIFIDKGFVTKHRK